MNKSRRNIPVILLLAALGSFGAFAAQTNIASVTDSFSLYPANSTKFVQTQYGLRIVYSTSAGVYTSFSSTGTSPWSAPVLLAAGGSQPSIAVTQNGTIAVAYVLSSTIYYRFLSGALWSSPVTLASGSRAAITSFRNDIHVAIADGSIRYLAFPVKNPLAGLLETVISGAACGVSVSSFPTITALPSSPGSITPLVLVGFSYFGPTGPPCGTNITLLTAYKRVSAGNWLPAGFPAPAAGAASISLSCNFNTGDCYLGLSFVNGAIEETNLSVKNLWTNGPTQQIVLLNRRAIISVAAFNDFNTRFRIAVSDFTMGSGGYGPAWYRTGTWSGASASPAWLGSQVSVSSKARDVQALSSESLGIPLPIKDPCKGDLTERFALIDQQISNTSYEILLDNTKTNVAVTCTATGGGGSKGN